MAYIQEMKRQIPLLQLTILVHHQTLLRIKVVRPLMRDLKIQTQPDMPHLTSDKMIRIIYLQSFYKMKKKKWFQVHI